MQSCVCLVHLQLEPFLYTRSKKIMSHSEISKDNSLHTVAPVSFVILHKTGVLRPSLTSGRSIFAVVVVVKSLSFFISILYPSCDRP
jgi:hypothetical protein